MKLTVTFAWLLVAASVANASLPHAGRSLEHARHARHLNSRVEVVPNLAHRDQATPKRCKPRPTVRVFGICARREMWLRAPVFIVVHPVRRARSHQQGSCPREDTRAGEDFRSGQGGQACAESHTR